MSDIDVSAANILGERGIRYKRNILAASLIATVLYWTEASLGEVSLFGVSLPNVEDKEADAWTIFLAILSYQSVMLAYYGGGDWRVWQQHIRETFSFSPLNIAFRMRNGAVMWLQGVPSEQVLIKIDIVPHGFAWSAEAPNKAASTGSFGHIDRENIRWRLIAFLTIEFGLPFLWGLICLYIAISKILGWRVLGGAPTLFGT